jgi:hypothetical protein
MTTQLPLFQSVKPRIIKRYKFDRSSEPIQVLRFCEDMLYVEREDPTVFKSCPACGAVYAFNTDFSYHHCLISCYGCGRKMWAREMNWNLSRKTIMGENQAFDWELCEMVPIVEQ